MHLNPYIKISTIVRWVERARSIKIQMKTTVIYGMIILLQSGILLNVFTEAPEEITYPMMIVGMAGAIIAIWRERNKTQERMEKRMDAKEDAHREDLKSIKDSIVKIMDKQTESHAAVMDRQSDVLSRHANVMERNNELLNQFIGQALLNKMNPPQE